MNKKREVAPGTASILIKHSLPFRRSIATAAVVISLGAMASSLSRSPSALAAENASTTADCGAEWRVVPSSNVGALDNILRKVAPVSADDVWAVGYSITGINLFQTMIQRWDGAQWNLIPSPNGGPSYNALMGVAANSSDDAWAVGYYDAGTEGVKTLIERWNGTVWSVVPSPNGGRDNLLQSVTTISANDAWAVGKTRTRSDVPFEGAYDTLILHWDGTEWPRVPSPNAGLGENVLFSVKAISANDVWAVGSYNNGAGVYESLILHWDGSTWSIVPSPSLGAITLLGSVDGVATDNVWAVGYYSLGAPSPLPIGAVPGAAQTFTVHWDGVAWNIVSSPNVSSFNTLVGVVTAGANDVWAVGSYYTDEVVQRTMVQHWNGSEWRVVPSPNAGTDDNGLAGIGAVPANGQRPRELWAVGAARGGSDRANRTLIERYNDPCALPPLQLIGVASRKMHGNAGPFVINLPLTGTPGIECRSGGASGEHTLVFKFMNELTSVGGASASATQEGGGNQAVAATGSINPTDQKEYIVNLTGVPNAQVLTVSLANVTDSAGNSSASVSASMGFLLGDVNQTGAVDGNDVSAVQATTRQRAGSTNFKADVNTSGTIDGNDVSIVQGKTRTRLP